MVVVNTKTITKLKERGAKRAAQHSASRIRTPSPDSPLTRKTACMCVCACLVHVHGPWCVNDSTVMHSSLQQPPQSDNGVRVQTSDVLCVCILRMAFAVDSTVLAQNVFACASLVLRALGHVVALQLQLDSSFESHLDACPADTAGLCCDYRRCGVFYHHSLHPRRSCEGYTSALRLPGHQTGPCGL